jgi:hypothetical protein
VRARPATCWGRLKRLVELQAKVTAAIAEEEDFLHGSRGISFRAIGRVRGTPEWRLGREYHQRHGEQERINGM